ncbi:MAG: phosphatase [Lachnospiraceae bacterium]|nr:phosphatase [Lachnospiraceae bacterium]
MKYILDTHTHTIASGHAYSTIDEMAKTAADRKLELLGITEHAPMMLGSCGEIYFSNLKVMPREKFGIKLLFGVELNIMDYQGTVDLPERLLKQMDICIASMHTPCVPYGTLEQNMGAFVGAMKNPYVNVIGHPDDGKYPVDYEALVLAAKEHHKLLEVNNNSLLPHSFRENVRENDITMLEFCKKHQVPVIVGSDAHYIDYVGKHQEAYSIFEEINFPEHLVANADMDLFLSFLNKK